MKPVNIAVTAALAAIVGVGGYAFGVGTATVSPGTAVAETVTTEGSGAANRETSTIAAFDGQQRDEIEAIIKDYLLSNPEIIRDAINELQRREQEADMVAQAKAITDNKDLIFASDRQVVLGNPAGDVTLVEFFDYNCGYCRRAMEDMQQLLDEDPNLRVVLKEFPVLGEGSVEAAQVSIAVKMVAPEKSGEFHVALLSEPGQVNADVALAVAEDMGLDRSALAEAMASEEVRDTITEVYALADTLSLTGTPSYVTSQEVVIGAIGYEALKIKLDEARASCETVVC